MNMKSKNLVLSLLILFVTLSITAQSDLSGYAGNWKMTPSNPSHAFSKISITNNGNTVSIKLKKSPLKSYNGRINPSTNRLEPYIDEKGYYLILGAANTMSLYEIDTNTKVGDYIK
jgi:hypothetical protein